MAGSFKIISPSTCDVSNLISRLAKVSVAIKSRFIINEYISFKDFWKNREGENRTSLMSIRLVIDKDYQIIEDDRESLLLNVRSQENQFEGYLIENEYEFQNISNKKWYVLVSNNEWEDRLCTEFCYTYLILNPDHYITIEGSKLLFNKDFIESIFGLDDMTKLNSNWPWENYTNEQARIT